MCASGSQNAHTLLPRRGGVHGVPASVIVGIIGVGAIHGRDMQAPSACNRSAHLPRWRSAIPTYLTAKRTTLFRNQLADYLLWCRDTSTDVFSVSGSFAGAVGIPQFMPTSLREVRHRLRPAAAIVDLLQQRHRRDRRRCALPAIALVGNRAARWSGALHRRRGQPRHRCRRCRRRRRGPPARSISCSRPACAWTGPINLAREERNQACWWLTCPHRAETPH
ncbi:lytic murein transglycosylase [Cupriavidus basilensis]